MSDTLVQTTIRFPEAVHDDLRQVAFDTRKPINQIVVDAVLVAVDPMPEDLARLLIPWVPLEHVVMPLAWAAHCIGETVTIERIIGLAGDVFDQSEVEEFLIADGWHRRAPDSDGIVGWIPEVTRG